MCHNSYLKMHDNFLPLEKVYLGKTKDTYAFYLGLSLTKINHDRTSPLLNKQ